MVVSDLQKKKTLAMLVGDSGSDDDDFKPAIRDAEKSKEAAKKMLDSDPSEDEDFKPAKKEPPKKAGAIGLPVVKKKEEFKPKEAFKQKATIRKTVAFADSDGDSDEGFAMVTMKPSPPKKNLPKPKMSNLFGGDDDSDDDDGGSGFGLPKPKAPAPKKNAPAAKPKTLARKTIVDSDESDEAPAKKPEKKPLPPAPVKKPDPPKKPLAPPKMPQIQRKESKVDPKIAALQEKMNLEALIS